MIINMEYIMSYVPTTQIEELITYCKHLRAVEQFNANFGKVKLIDDFIEKLENLDIETGVLK